ncbi:FreB [Arthroderma uncinatum]|uniref:FreB n=1 Tax=Arthroderma uncinatum TaxID=74035 RepID=UPI00144AA10F|nr:FreB [Arthroderma uncinatum]KAF3481181.1 FreB [Arthroderma uncinatum]
MDIYARELAAPHSQNTTYVSPYTRGLLGVRVNLDRLVTLLLCVSIGAVCLFILITRFTQMSHSYLRQVTSATASPNQQRFWGAEQSTLWADIKNHVLYAPLGRKRHNREFKLSEAVNVGTLPSRFHSVLLIFYLLSQVAYCSVLDYRANNKAALVAELRGRSGNLAVLNMIPLFVLAGRNNPLIPLLRVSFDTYNLIHRWLGRIVIIESVVHTVAWMINAVGADGLEKMWYDVCHEPFYIWGFVATVTMIFVLIQSPSPIRHAFYETFLHLHQLFALVVVVGIYFHLHMDNLPQLPWFQFIIGIWAFERIMRFARLVYLNVSRRNGLTRVVVKALPGEASRVTFYLPRHAKIAPGSHVYAYLPRISLWMSHPFSVAWAESGSGSLPKSPKTDKFSDSSKAALSRKPSTMSSSTAASSPRDLEKGHGRNIALAADDSQPTCVSLIMAARTGMTRKLYNAALASPNLTLETTGFIEGPYSSHPSSFGSYGTVVLFSGGAGITHHLMHVRDLLAAADAGTIATRRVYLIWSVRTTEHLAWVRGFMDSILHMPNRRDVLVTKLFVSKPRSQREIQSPSTTLQMFPGRCRPDVVLEEVLSDPVGATGVSVCGPGAFADEVRSSVRKRIGNGQVIDFVEEAFTW